jgi:GNAT superfamily N-acetyltransferase
MNTMLTLNLHHRKVWQIVKHKKKGRTDGAAPPAGNSTTTLRRGRIKDARKMAELHRTAIAYGFLSSLGVGVLEHVYKALFQCEGSFVMVAEEDGDVVGFAAAVNDTRKFYICFIRKYALRTAIGLLPKLASKRVARKMFETLRQPFKKTPGAAGREGMPELLSIAVVGPRRNKRIGSSMLAGIIDMMRESGQKGMMVVVSLRYPEAVAFYKKSRFVKVCETEVHKGEPSVMFSIDFGSMGSS